MEKELPSDFLERGNFTSGPANKLLEMLRLSKTYRVTVHLEEMEDYVREFSGNYPLRKTLIISDPIHADEMGFLEYRIKKLYRPQDFDYMKRFKNLQTSLSFSMEYNIGIPQLTEHKDEKTLFHNASDEILVISYPQGFFVLHERNRGEETFISHEADITLESLAANPELLEDAMWDTFWKHPPIAV